MRLEISTIHKTLRRDFVLFTFACFAKRFNKKCKRKASKHKFKFRKKISSEKYLLDVQICLRGRDRSATNWHPRLT